MESEEKNEYLGTAALEKAASLLKISIDHENWTKEYVDEVNGQKWVMDFPDSDAHGGGPPRLKRIKS